MKRLWVCICLLVSFSYVNAGSLELPHIFSSNMVLQRDKPIPVWGKSLPGATVTLEFAGETQSTVAKPCGAWKIRLNERPAGGPYVMTISAVDTTIVFHNILLGDVWIASGQSNMQWSVNNSNNPEKEIANANYPSIRLFTVPHSVSGFPKTDVTGGEWVECSPQTIPGFSAVAYFFGRELHNHLDVPIGLLHTSWGGTPAEAWTSADMLHSIPDYKSAAQTLISEKPDYELLNKAQQPLAERYNDLVQTANEGIKAGVHKTKFDDSEWRTMTVPGYWEENGLPNFNGFVWFRKTITVPAEAKSQQLVLNIGRIPQSDITYFNGTEIGRTGGDQIYRSYTIPAELMRAGENVIAVRITNRWGNGGFSGSADSMGVFTATGEKLVDITGEWRFDESSEPELPNVVGYQHRPAALYNAMIAPLVPYAITGAIWYQGESNAGRAYQYRTLFPKMIEDWRVRWGQGYFLFLFVQLANFMEVLPEPSESNWAELREAQLKTLDFPNTGQAVTIDIGEADDIHPRNKQDVGKRLALAARHIAYGEDIVYSGPIYKSMQVEENQIVLSFDHIGSGLTAKGDKLEGFAIAGNDRKFVWADAEIQGDQILVSSPKVAEPAAVRYAWANNPECNLYNKEGLPASPFRTDAWPGITEP